MPTLKFASIKCNSKTNWGGPIQLRVAIPQTPNQPPPWGPTNFTPNQVVNFNALPLPQQPAAVPFFNPVRVELWDSQYSAKVTEIEIRPTNVGSSPSSPPAPPTFSYFGGTYTLNYVVTANVAGVLFSYVSSVCTLVATFVINFIRLTLETARSVLQLIFAPFRRLDSGKNRDLESTSPESTSPESTSKNDSEPLNPEVESKQKRDAEKIRR
ncbi:MAG: hypothetical protein WCA35_01180 [Kovacikia sp.]